MKKWFVLFLTIFLTLSFFGCSPDPVVPDENEQTIETDENLQIEQVETEKQTSVEKETTNGENENAKQEQVEKSVQEKSDKTKERTVEISEQENEKEQTSSEADESKNESTSASEGENPEQTEKSTEPQDTVTITIVGLDGPIIPSTKVNINSDDTVLSVTIRLLKEKGIQYEYSGKGATAYVHGIDNLYEMDEGPLSGWLYKRNGTIVSRSAGAEPVQNGDLIEWFYTEDYTKY
ncbi:DUF4430 domain-containing protein [Fervidibacillus albus]|uniref:DUF4430 domain-containing protein n=1 Tax=Fervidibacillus albus TaxID=2980026 RepID=A0A9E8RXI3_9BACI|nr:DUF4430 domain-containing protein [Fervidibacillus albus]WAA09587.1 DUF4430 domain-containing protein [Fervidibacillus albus]